MGISKRELLILASLMVMAAVLYIFVLHRLRMSVSRRCKRTSVEASR